MSNLDFLRQKLEIKEWGEKIISFLLTNSTVYILKVLLGVLGISQLLYLLGYLSLYGFFFGGSDNSLLDVGLKYVPFSYFLCVVTGIFIAGFVLFYCTFIKLTFDKKIEIKETIITLILFPAAVNLLYPGIVANAKFVYNSQNLLTFMFVWIYPILITITLVITWVTIKFFKRLLGSNKGSDVNRKNFNFIQTIIYFSCITSLVIVLVVPLISLLTFSTGNSMGSILVDSRLYLNEEIKIKENIYSGKVVGSDSNYLYISTPNRKLLRITLDGETQIIKGKIDEISVRKVGDK
ncbi:hypothetical protein [Brevibacillus choshinensis]|uniref:hypothetical protein n=1 Tax=Brevibacillus choshinensis TaxID=54911 RepID=UPI002E1C6CAC|nr:hypothetical protein [Brevibacillus choshinensis]